MAPITASVASVAFDRRRPIKKSTSASHLFRLGGGGYLERFRFEEVVQDLVGRCRHEVVERGHLVVQGHPIHCHSSSRHLDLIGARYPLDSILLSGQDEMQSSYNCALLVSRWQVLLCRFDSKKRPGRPYPRASLNRTWLAVERPSK